MKKNFIILSAAWIIFSVQLLHAQVEHMMMKKSTILKAVALITPTKGNSVQGVVTFEKVDKGVRIIANLTGLKSGRHGFHIHEFGDITATDGSSAGGHFNPMDMPHNTPMTSKRHAGDMGNINADEKGNAHLDYIDPIMKLDGESSIVGHAVIIHEKEDDFKTQPTGNAGARIAYGVIGIAK
jgi:superoxide dismutase, Cu-Zn family